MPVGQRDDARLVARQLERGGERLAHDAFGVLGRREPRGGASQALGGRGGADGADLFEAGAQQRGGLLDLGHGVGVDRGQRLGVERADHLAGDAQRQADLGAHARHGGDVVRRLADVVDDHAQAGAERAPDDPGARGEAVEDLPEAARGLAAQAPGLCEVDDRQQPASREVLDHGLARLARRSGALEVALEPAAGHGGPATAGGRRRQVLRPGLARAAEQPALAVVDLHPPQRLELLGALDAFGDDARADLAGEGGGGAQDRLARRVTVDAGDHAARELEEVGADVGDVLERREASAGVVDGDERAAGDPWPQPLAQQRVVEDGVLLGQLDHEPRREPPRDFEQPGMAERLGREVDPQQAAVRRHAGGGDRRPARDLELVAQARVSRGGERHVRRQRDEAGRRREPRQALVADRPQVRQAHDRLEHGTDRAGRQQCAEIVCASHVLVRSARAEPDLSDRRSVQSPVRSTAATHRRPVAPRYGSARCSP